MLAARFSARSTDQVEPAPGLMIDIVSLVSSVSCELAEEFVNSDISFKFY